MHAHYTGNRDPINCPANQPDPKDQPKPTTGEWTAATVAACLNNRLDAAQTIADAHNTSLAAERENLKEAQEEAFAAYAEVDAIREQLANLQEKWDKIADEPMVQALRKADEALAAEREEHRLVCSVVEEKLVRLNKQLTAERENLATVRELRELDQKALAAERSKAEQERLRIWREAPNQPDIQESVIAKLNLVSGDALTAAVDEFTRYHHNPIVADLNKKLADERETSKQARAAERHMEACRALLKVPDDEVLYGAIEELQQQLAAERKGHEMDGQLISNQESEISQLREQLTTEREKMQTLMNVLKEIKGLCGMPSERRGKSGMRLVKILNVTVAGLAKVKECK